MVADTAPRTGQLVLVLPDGHRVPIDGELTIGRADGASVRLDDLTVSRRHARIVLAPDGPVIEDAGSRFGVLVDGEAVTDPRSLGPDSEIRLGNVVLRVASEPRPDPNSTPDVNATLVVPIRATDDRPGAAALPADGPMRPRQRSGWALKRVADDGPDVRYVLRDLRSNAFVRIDEHDAQLFRLLDGRQTIDELLAEASRLVGSTGPARLARLIAECGDRGMLDGIAAAPRVHAEPGLLRRVLEPREWTFESLADWFQDAYDSWGRWWFSPLSATGLILLSLGGLVTFSYLIGARYGTPLVVAHRLVLGGLVFIAGRFVLVLSLRYYDRLSALAPHDLVVAGFIGFFVLLLMPVAIALGMPLLRRARFGTTEVNRVIR